MLKLIMIDTITPNEVSANLQNANTYGSDPLLRIITDSRTKQATAAASFLLNLLLTYNVAITAIVIHI